MKTAASLPPVVLAVLALGACYKPSAKPAPTPPTSVFPAGLFLAADPGGAKPIAALRAEAKVGDTVTLRGRVGGEEKPFAEGLAVMKVVDVGTPITCGPDDPCPTRWDYCCTPLEELKANSALVEVHGPAGVLAGSLRGAGAANKLAEFSLVTVVGQVTDNAKGNLAVQATNIYVGPVDADGKIAGTPVKGMK